MDALHHDLRFALRSFLRNPAFSAITVLTLAVVGIAVGVGAALWLTRLLTGILYGVRPTDPLSFASVVTLLLDVALAASYLPARRAARVDPMSVLWNG
jgi:putative ABC transport system permease protein